MDVDTLVRRILVTAGSLFLATGVAMAVQPSIAAALPVGGGVVTVLGVVAVLLGGLAGRSRLRDELTEFETPDPERPADDPTPGDDIDRALFEMTRLRQGVDEHRGNTEEQLTWIGVAVIRERQDCSEAEAVRRLETGEWTDDEVAAAFFGEVLERQQGDDEFDSVLAADWSVGEWEERLARTVEALIDVAELDLPALDRTPAEEQSLLDSLGGALRGDEETPDDDGVETNRNVADSDVESFDTTDPFEEVTVHRTNRWLGVTGLGLLALGVGTVVANPGLMLAGAVGIVYTGYARLEGVPPLEGLAVEREFDETDPRPGEAVQVTVTVRNEGGSVLPDLVFVDAVPDAFVVTGGSPRLHTALRPGASATFQYTVEVERGEHEWPLLAVGRDFSGAVERAALLTPDAPLVCLLQLTETTDVPVRAQTTQYSGDVSTSSAGAGLEFHSTRDHQPGDPLNRVNWKRLARTGELGTVDFRQERAAKVTLLFDTRESAYASRGPGESHAVDLSVDAAGDVFSALYDAGNLVGVAAFDTVPCWLGPGAGDEHVERARQLFTKHPALSSRPPGQRDADGPTREGGYIDPMIHVRRRLAANSQVFVFSPLVDDYSADVARRLDSMGHLVTVISPDVTAAATVGQRLTTIERTTRVRLLREHGIRVIDWDPDEGLDLELRRARARWSA